MVRFTHSISLNSEVVNLLTEPLLSFTLLLNEAFRRVLRAEEEEVEVLDGLLLLT